MEGTEVAVEVFEEDTGWELFVAAEVDTVEDIEEGTEAVVDVVAAVVESAELEARNLYKAEPSVHNVIRLEEH